jgi:peptidyl-prolyl cis-trans isomerase B (cyclophilin B)
MTDLEELFTSATALAEQEHPAPPNALMRLAEARRSRRRRRAAWIGAPLSAAVVAAAVLVPTVLLGDPQDSGPSSLAGGDAWPHSFVALRDGHAGLYDAGDGSLQRDLGPAVAVAAGPDAYWSATSSGCDGGMLRETVVDPAVGRASSMTQVGLVTAIAASPDGRMLAYAEDVPAAHPDGAAPCGGSDLVVVNRRTGDIRRWSGRGGVGQISSLVWSSDSRQLAFQVTSCCESAVTVHVLHPATAAEGAVDKIDAVPARVDSCLRLPAYLDNQLVAVRGCQDKTELVALDERGVRSVLRELPDDPQGLAVAGDRILLQGPGDADRPGPLLLIDRDGTTTIGRGLAAPSWVPVARATTTASPVPTQEPSPEASAGPSEGHAGGVACSYPRSSEGKVARDVGRPPDRAVDLPSRMTIRTNRGDVTVDLRVRETPCTVNSLAFLARAGYFDGIACHRLTTQGIFVVQCGDPTGTGVGSPGYTFPDEALEGVTYPAGTVAMANAGPDTNGSQFFLVYDDTQLDANYTVFGRITDGIDVLKAVAAGGAEPAADGKPKLRLEITGITFG